MLKLHDFECEDCGVVEEALIESNNLPILAVACKACGGKARKIMGAPAIHTLETHFRGMKEMPGDPKWRPGHGEYQDENLTDAKGNPLVYRSLSEKNKLLKERGLFQKEPLEKGKRRRSERPMIFTKQGSKRSQLAINH